MPKAALSEQIIVTDSDWSGWTSVCECVNSALSFEQYVSTETGSLNQVLFRDGADVDLCCAHTLQCGLASGEKRAKFKDSLKMDFSSPVTLIQT